MVAAMHRPTRLKMTDLNPHLMCVLCGGYFIDATTIIECLHSFCKSCIVRYLETSKYCPVCDVQIHKTKPLLSIRSDQTLQEIVYKLVPGLFQNEMQRRREFYAKHPHEAAKRPLSGYCEERGEVEGAQRFVGCADENINFSLEYRTERHPSEGSKLEKCEEQMREKRFLRCPAAVTIAHLKKLVRAKYSLTADHKVELFCSNDCLDDDFSLMDISYIYSWRRKGQLRLFYRIYESVKRRKMANDEAGTSSTVTSQSTTKETVPVSTIEIPKTEKETRSQSQTANPPTVADRRTKRNEFHLTNPKENGKIVDHNKKLVNGDLRRHEMQNHSKQTDREKETLTKNKQSTEKGKITEKLNGIVDDRECLINKDVAKT